jgi:hypothetical protein
MNDTFACPHCGAAVPVGASACPACGSDENTGWSEEAEFAHLLPDDEEASSGLIPTPGVPWLPFLIGVGAVVVVLLFLSREGLILPFLLLAALAAALLVRRSRTVGPLDRETELYDRLLTRARGDRALVDRLVAYESEQKPGKTRAQHLADALERWERDAR